MSDKEKDFGLQPGGAVKMKKDDFALKLFKNMSCWRKETQTTTGDRPWIKSENWRNTYTMKYLNYETDSKFVNLENPLLIGEGCLSEMNQDLPRTPKVKNLSKDFSVTKQAVSEVSANNRPKEGTDSDEDNFLDCYGNIISSSTNKGLGHDCNAREEKWNNYDAKEDNTGDAYEDTQGRNIPRQNRRKNQDRQKNKQLFNNNNNILPSAPGKKRFWKDVNVTEGDKEMYNPALDNLGITKHQY